MQRPLTLLAALALAAVFGSATLASADCAYHKSQAAVDTAKLNKEVVTAPVLDTTTADQVQTTQISKPAKPATDVKK